MKKLFFVVLLAITASTVSAQNQNSDAPPFDPTTEALWNNIDTFFPSPREMGPNEVFPGTGLLVPQPVKNRSGQVTFTYLVYIKMKSGQIVMFVPTGTLLSTNGEELVPDTPMLVTVYQKFKRKPRSIDEYDPNSYSLVRYIRIG